MEEVNASHKKEEREKSTAKKVAQPLKLITATIKKGGKLRDVGTQIIYNNKDGQNLSLMELDILRHTGCKWSRIIFEFRVRKEIGYSNDILFIKRAKFCNCGVGTYS